jgi:hypothetical protein
MSLRGTAAAVAAMAVALCVAQGASAMTYVWWEGEAAFEHNFDNRSFPASSLDHPDALSGGDWLNRGGPVPPGGAYARWHVSVPQGGGYFLYARKFWHHGPFRWRFDQGEWQTAENLALIDSVDLRKFVVANWVSLGPVDLGAGEHVFEVRLLAKPGEEPAAAFDCFALTSSPWTPSGKTRPGEKTGLAAPGWWAFEPDPDTFQDSPIDLRHLNDKVAGDRGFLQADGLNFVFQKEGKPVRFWAVCTGPNTVEMDKASVDYLARRLAKLGVNMIRIHGPLFDRNAADPATVDMAYLDKLHYFVHAMKQQGIYSYLSIYFPLWFDVKPGYGLPGYDKTENKTPFALLFFNPRMQQIYRSWARTLLTSPNPYTGLSLADDPAVGIYEIVNEDNYFFWTFTPGTNIPWECMPPLEERFGAWAARKYGSLAAALKAWNYPNERDDVPAGRAGLLNAWAMTRQGVAALPAARRRIADQVQFLTEDLRGFYAGMHKWLRDQVGVKCPIVATNWTTADNDQLGALDKYADMACEVLDRHGYWAPPQKADRPYALTAGDLFRNGCGLEVPEQLPVRELQYAGHPCTVSEYLFTRINCYRTDSVFLAAVYGALQGTDGYFWFAINGPGWQTASGEGPASPAIMGQFPAAALIYRRGDVREAPTVVDQVLSLDDLYALKGSGTSDPQNLDNMRAAEVPPGGQAVGKPVSNIDPLSHYVGRVLRTISDDRSQAVLTDLSPYIDRTAKTVRSITGEALLDYGRALATVNTPPAQAATGFLARAGRIALGDVTIESGNDYGAVMVVSLDGRPIASAGKVLVQAATQEQNYGWQDVQQGEWRKVTSLGTPPIDVKDVAGTVTIVRPDATQLKVTALDPNGYPTDRKVETTAADGRLTVTLLPDVLYYVVEGR